MEGERMIEIYGKPNCPFCVKAVNLCKMRQLEHTYKSLGTDYSREELLEWFPGARTVPQIKIRGENIGGYNDLEEYLDNTGYNGTGHTL
jgi:glutaredoxin